MGGMPGFIAKVPITKRVDQLSRAFLNDRPKREEFLNAFLSALNDRPLDDYYSILRHYKILLTDAEQQHLANHWFNDNDQGWWKQAGPVKEIHRRSLIEAFTEAKERDLPIDSYWICTAHHSFDVCIGWNDRQVTRIILSPPAIEDSDPKKHTQP